MLPYGAVSWCEVQAETCSKKDFSIKRSKIVARRRSKRLNNSLDVLSCSTLDRNFVNKDIIIESTEVEQLREPVLFKLAKEEKSFKNVHDVYLGLDKVSKSNQRSIWSILYSKEQVNKLNGVTKCSFSEENAFSGDGLVNEDTVVSRVSGVGFYNFGIDSLLFSPISSSSQISILRPPGTLNELTNSVSDNYRVTSRSFPQSNLSSGFTNRSKNSAFISSKDKNSNDFCNTQTINSNLYKVSKRGSVLSVNDSMVSTSGTHILNVDQKQLGWLPDDEGRYNSCADSVNNDEIHFNCIGKKQIITNGCCKSNIDFSCKCSSKIYKSGGARRFLTVPHSHSFLTSGRNIEDESSIKFKATRSAFEVTPNASQSLTNRSLSLDGFSLCNSVLNRDFVNYSNGDACFFPFNPYLKNNEIDSHCVICDKDGPIAGMFLHNI